MLADVCEESCCTGNLSTHERGESWIKWSEESNLTNDLCQLSTFARMTLGKKVAKPSLPCSVFDFSLQDNGNSFPPSRVKATGKMGLKHFVTKLMRLHYHLGFYAYVTQLFMGS